MLDDKYLSKLFIKEQLYNRCEEEEIDYTELPSYKYTSERNYNWVLNPEPAEDDWEEAEELVAKLEQIQRRLEGDFEETCEELLPFDVLLEPSEVEKQTFYMTVMQVLEEQIDLLS